MDKIKEIVKKCDICNLNPKHKILGSGFIPSKILFVTPFPDWYADKKGKIFSSKEMKFFKDMIKKSKIQEKDYYMTSILKCKTPKSRKPTEKEIQNCIKFLEMQINLLKPDIICAVGSSTRNMLAGSNQMPLLKLPRKKKKIAYPIFYVMSPELAMNQPEAEKILLSQLSEIRKML